MKFLILGSTGDTGRLVTSLALERGHEVRVLVRDVTRADLRATVVEGDARSRESVSSAMLGMDVVISALGMGLATTPNGLIVDATEAIIAGAESTGTKRLVMLSSWGVGDTLGRSSALVRFIYKAGRRVHDEKARAEVVLRSSSLDWTLLYPVALTNGDPTGRARGRIVEDVIRIPGVPKISRADVAAAMVEIAEKGTWSRRTVVLDT